MEKYLNKFKVEVKVFLGVFNVDVGGLWFLVIDVVKVEFGYEVVLVVVLGEDFNVFMDEVVLVYWEYVVVELGVFFLMGVELLFCFVIGLI